MTQEQDLLTGNVPKKLIQFAFPLFLANLLQALYNVVDMLVVGKIVGEIGLAAISNASMLCFIINSLCIGLTMGGSVLVAQYKGAGDQKGQRDTIGMLFLLSLAASVVVTMLGLAVYEPLFRALDVPAAVYEPLFRALDVPAEAYPDACGYMEIICWGTVFVFGYNTVCSILKGLGDSKTPLFFVGAATILNVLLDVLLVGPCSMGTAGAAWATITAQGSMEFFPRKNGTSPGNPTGYFEGGPANRNPDGGGKHGLSAGDGNAQSLRHRGGRRLRRGTEDQHLCRDALLGHWAGHHRHGGPVHGSRPDPAGPSGSAVRSAVEPCRHSGGSGVGPVSGRTSHPPV